MEEYLKGLVDEMEEMEAKLYRKRYVYYHIQNWVHMGLIRDKETLIKVYVYCDTYYPRFDLPQCYKMAMKEMRRAKKC